MTTDPAHSDHGNADSRWEPPAERSRPPAISAWPPNLDADPTPRPGPKSKGFRLTKNDMRTLTCILRHRYLTQQQLTFATGLTRRQINNRFVHYRRAGLVRAFGTPESTHKMWALTRTGIEITNGGTTQAVESIPLPARHALWLVDLCSMYEERGEVVWTEREYRAWMRKNQTRPNPIEDSLVTARRKADREFFPDLLLVRPPVDGHPQNIGIELELHRKDRRLIEKKLRWYASSSVFGLVVYLCIGKEVSHLIHTCAAATGTSGIVQVQEFHPLPDSGIDPDV